MKINHISIKKYLDMKQFKTQAEKENAYAIRISGWIILAVGFLVAYINFRVTANEHISCIIGSSTTVIGLLLIGLGLFLGHEPEQSKI